MKPTASKHDKNPQRRRALAAASATEKNCLHLRIEKKKCRTVIAPKWHTNITEHVTMLTRAMYMRAFYRQFVFVLFEQSQLHPLPFDYSIVGSKAVLISLREMWHAPEAPPPNKPCSRTATKKKSRISTNQSIIQSIKREKVCLNGFNFFFHSFVRLHIAALTILCCTRSKVMQGTSFRGTKRLCLNEFKFEISVTCNFQASLIWFSPKPVFSSRIFHFNAGESTHLQFECELFARFATIPPQLACRQGGKAASFVLRNKQFILFSAKKMFLRLLFQLNIGAFDKKKNVVGKRRKTKMQAQNLFSLTIIVRYWKMCEQ